MVAGACVPAVWSEPRGSGREAAIPRRLRWHTQPALSGSASTSGGCSWPRQPPHLLSMALWRDPVTSRGTAARPEHRPSRAAELLRPRFRDAGRQQMLCVLCGRYH